MMSSTSAETNPTTRFTAIIQAFAGTSILELEDFVGAKFYCPHALADGKQHIWIREKTLEFSTVLSTLSTNLAVSVPLKRST